MVLKSMQFVIRLIEAWLGVGFVSAQSAGIVICIFLILSWAGVFIGPARAMNYTSSLPSHWTQTT